MAPKTRFNPIESARHISDAYRSYLVDLMNMEDPELRAQYETLLSEPERISKGPYLEATPPFVKGATPREAVEAGLLNPGVLELGGFDPDRPFYRHQVRAIKAAHEGRNLLVTTGTGSGKTECFLIPIISDILDEIGSAGRQVPGIRAMLLYPMNALANDQVRRLRTLLKGTNITFGRYTGATAERHDKALENWQLENPDERAPMPNEILSREEIRANPPNIILTNYSMLEYLLLRPSDASLFGKVFGASWRHLAIDEAHIYSGTLGSEIAYLVRRLKARIEYATGRELSLRCYATSATIGSRDEIPAVAQFAQDLFGEPFDADSVILGEQENPTDDFRAESWGALEPSDWHGLRDVLADSDEDALVDELDAFLSDRVPAAELERFRNSTGGPLERLGSVLLGEIGTKRLVEAMLGDVLDLGDPESTVRVGLEGMDPDIGLDLLQAMVEVLSLAQRTQDVPILTSRYHAFISALDGLYIDLSTKRLFIDRRFCMGDDPDTSTPVYELSVCSRCGQMYILGGINRLDGGNLWLNPRHSQQSSEDDFEPRIYFELDPSEEDIDARGEDDEVWNLCPVCGAVSQGGIRHRFEHGECEPVRLMERRIGSKGKSHQSTEVDAQCTHCGYRSRHAIQPLRVSPEAAGDIVCRELAHDVPPFLEDEEPGANDEFFDDDLFDDDDEAGVDVRRPGSVICFSDRRQDAAYFAPNLAERNRKETFRQVLLEAVGRGGNRTPSKLAKALAYAWLQGEESVEPDSTSAWKPLLGDSNEEIDERDLQRLANTWILDELSAMDRRRSLEGVGLLKVVPKPFLKIFDVHLDDDIEDALDQLEDDGVSYLGKEDLRIISRFCLDTLRFERCISRKGTIEDRSFLIGGADRSFAGTADERAQDKHDVAFRSTYGNQRSGFVTHYVKRTYGREIDRHEANLILDAVFDLIINSRTVANGKLKKLIAPKAPGRYQLAPRFFEIEPVGDHDHLWRCDRCGAIASYDTHGTCTTNRCEGTMVAFEPEGRSWQNDFQRRRYREVPMPMSVEEHTAQLSTQEAHHIQDKFIRGTVNVLSCTTTFELGVDVGDLRAVFMRNIPPGVANYTQRAGRTGRRAGMPGFSVTFARLRSHDQHFYRHPLDIIKGVVRAPHCHLGNAQIALRHVYATAMSAFFREKAADSPNIVRYYDEFMDVSEEMPHRLGDLRRAFGRRPEEVSFELKRILPDKVARDPHISADSWGWVESLVSSDQSDPGRLYMTHMGVHADYARLRTSIELAEQDDEQRYGNRLRYLNNRLADVERQNTIGVLAAGGVLPKYGFPTDLVTLNLEEQERYSDGFPKLDLNRSMRQAITEYAPDSSIVAGGHLWESRGFVKPSDRNLDTRQFGTCPKCEAFNWPIDSGEEVATCRECGAELTLDKLMVLPTYGFFGRESKGWKPSERRPVNSGSMLVYFGHRWKDMLVERDTRAYPGGSVTFRAAQNEPLCLVNKGPAAHGYNVCLSCGAAQPIVGNAKGKGLDKKRHQRWCKHPRVRKIDAIGATLTSDVLELAFDVPALMGREPKDCRSLMWAIVRAASELLAIPDSEISGTVYQNGLKQWCVLLYDNVPGGAGLVASLPDYLDDLFELSYTIVADCTCGLETCCYGCIATFNNQFEQERLSRGAVVDILGELLGTKTSSQL